MMQKLFPLTTSFLLWRQWKWCTLEQVYGVALWVHVGVFKFFIFFFWRIFVLGEKIKPISGHSICFAAIKFCWRPIHWTMLRATTSQPTPQSSNLIQFVPLSAFIFFFVSFTHYNQTTLSPLFKSIGIHIIRFSSLLAVLHTVHKNELYSIVLSISLNRVNICIRNWPKQQQQY